MVQKFILKSVVLPNGHSNICKLYKVNIPEIMESFYKITEQLRLYLQNDYFLRCLLILNTKGGTKCMISHSPYLFISLVRKISALPYSYIIMKTLGTTGKSQKILRGYSYKIVHISTANCPNL